MINFLNIWVLMLVIFFNELLKKIDYGMNVDLVILEGVLYKRQRKEDNCNIMGIGFNVGKVFLIL